LYKEFIYCNPAKIKGYRYIMGHSKSYIISDILGDLDVASVPLQTIPHRNFRKPLRKVEAYANTSLSEAFQNY
jgi:hypothetical protein